MRPLLSQADVDSIHQQLSAADLPWLDGRLTAGEQAASVKKNHQLDPSTTPSSHRPPGPAQPVNQLKPAAGTKRLKTQ